MLNIFLMNFTPPTESIFIFPLKFALKSTIFNFNFYNLGASLCFIYCFIPKELFLMSLVFDPLSFPRSFSIDFTTLCLISFSHSLIGRLLICFSVRSILRSFKYFLM